MNEFAHGGIYGGVIVTILMTTTAMALWFERKMAARMQSRIGPTIVGPFGLLQPFADVLKLLQKEDIVPEKADSGLFNLAPPLGAIAAIAVAAIVPFSPDIIAADLDAGVLYLLAIGALGVTRCSWRAGRATTSSRCSEACAPSRSRCPTRCRWCWRRWCR